jgi:Tfp pilus assembly protein FimT
VELLVVVAIIAIMMGILALGIQGMSSSSLQTAASQVSSGLSLARQYAISRNSAAAFIVATNTNGAGMPSEPYKYWSVVSSNRGATNWTLVKDWERLPEGAVFLEMLRTTSSPPYRTINNNPMPSGTPGAPFMPANMFLQQNLQITAPGSIQNTNFQGVVFTPNGTALGSGHIGIRLAQGSVANNQVILRNTNNFYFVESDTYTGRIRVRAPESYR